MIPPIYAQAMDEVFSPQFLMGCLIWIPVGIWVVCLINWMIMGDVDPVTGILGVTLGLCLGSLALLNENRMLTPFIFAAVISIMILFPVVRGSYNRSELAKIDIETIERAYETLDEKPGHFSALFRMCGGLHARGLSANAEAIGRKAIEGLRKELVREEIRLINIWASAARRQTLPARTLCPRCGRVNQLEAIYCEGCSGPYLLWAAKNRWIHAGLVKKVVSIWTAGVALLVGIPWFLTAMETPISILGVFLMVAVAAVMLWLGLRKPARESVFD
jgi:membrane protein implicated in regulation of membrane protease activity